jgi:PHD/YefM family antitoxin component YafN of YafNO toxin-antitoxin module
MRTIPATEIKRRGISAVDGVKGAGPVHVIKNNRPAYVVLTEADYEALTGMLEGAELRRVRRALSEIRAGKGRRTSAGKLITELGLES